MKLKQKRDIQRQRTIRYFIDAANTIAKNEGISRITIRNVSDLAGYNSATLYNYFENIEQLIAFSMLDNITEYFESLDFIQEMKLDALTSFLLAWRCYAEYSFKNPEIYSYLFNSKHSEYALSQIGAYYEATSLSSNTRTPLTVEESLKKRDALFISPCIKEGFFDTNQKEYIMDFCYIVHGGISSQLETQLETDPNNAVEKFLDYTTEFLNTHLKKKPAIPITSQYVLSIKWGCNEIDV